MRTLFTPENGNAKIAKSLETNRHATMILHLLPASLSGWNVCAQSTPACRHFCLNTTGRGAFTKVQQARLERTQLYFNDRQAFLAQIRKEIRTFIRRCTRKKLTPSIRLNGTSDIPWERVDPNLFQEFPDLQFYDYTKLERRMLKYLDGYLPANYHLTFSRTESNDSFCNIVLRHGGSVAAIVEPGAYHYIPSILYTPGVTTLDGDEYDQRFLDPDNSLVILKPKGTKAKNDTTGMVIRLPH